MSGRHVGQVSEQRAARRQGDREAAALPRQGAAAHGRDGADPPEGPARREVRRPQARQQARAELANGADAPGAPDLDGGRAARRAPGARRPTRRRSCRPPCAGSARASSAAARRSTRRSRVAPSFYGGRERAVLGASSPARAPPPASRPAPSRSRRAYDPVREELAAGFRARGAGARGVRRQPARRSRRRSTRLRRASRRCARGLTAATPLLDETAGFARATTRITRIAPAALRETSVLLRKGGPALKVERPAARPARPTPCRRRSGSSSKLDPVIEPVDPRAREQRARLRRARAPRLRRAQLRAQLAQRARLRHRAGRRRPDRRRSTALPGRPRRRLTSLRVVPVRARPSSRR